MKIYHNKSGICYTTVLVCLSLLLAHCSHLPGKQVIPLPKETCSYHAHLSSPARILLTLTEHPSTSQAVTWRTNDQVTHPKAQIAPSTDSPAFIDNASTIPAKIEKVSLGKNTFVYYYSAVLDGLKPGTIYAYRVGADDSWSEWNQFKTAGLNGDPLTFVYFGDAQKDVKSLCARIFRAAYKKAPDANFWLFVGDLVANGDKDEEWADFI